MMNQIIVADDHGFVRKGLVQILQEAFPHCVVTEVSDGEQLVAACRVTRFDAIITDVSMPKISGLQALLELGKVHPQVPIVVLSMFADRQYIVLALQRGAHAYLTKEDAVDLLVLALEKIKAGEKFVSESARMQASKAVLRFQPSTFEKELSRHQLELLDLQASGLSFEDIGAIMNLLPAAAEQLYKDINQQLSFADLHHLKTVLEQND